MIYNRELNAQKEKEDKLNKMIKSSNEQASIKSMDDGFAVNLKSKKTEEEPKRERSDRQSDRIMQNILNASKLLEGRISFEQLVSLDIPTFESIVDNEFANIDSSYAAFKANGAINAYTKNETTNVEAAALKQMTKG